ncbi:MAG: hypothetical protein M0Z99_25875 [Betaproteobacteria bacterium]|nr:hypothetical protein [Betaproteobacteria bacterium]
MTPSAGSPPQEATSPLERGSARAPLLIGFDAEWVDVGKGRRSVLSQQFCVRAADGSLVTAVYEFPLRRRGRTRYRLSSMLKALFEDLQAVGIDVSLYSARGAVPSPVKAATADEAAGKRSGKNPKDRAQRTPTFAVVLLSHYSIVDFTTFYDSQDLLRLVDSARGTVVTTARPLSIRVTDQWRNSSRRIVVHLRDTMMLAAAGSKLAALGERVGLPKLDLPEGYAKDGMDRLQAERPQDFICYGARDAEVALLHAEKVIGQTAGVVPISLGSQAARIFQEAICSERSWTKEQFDSEFRGLNKVTEKITDGAGMRTHSYLTPRTEATMLLDVSTRCYFGGRNECFLYGIHRAPAGRVWHDYDLASAYPTAMVLVPDPDYSQPPGILTGRLGRGMIGPTSWSFGYVHFRFPDKVFYPCLPIKDDAGRGLVFPREGETWASAPELWLALEMGAQIDLIMPMLVQPTKNSYGLATGVKRLVELRLEARAQFGKGSTEELAAKERANSSYGKLAQGLAGTRVYSTRHDKTDRVPPSSITSAPHAALTTSLVRMIVSAAMNELHALGYIIASITTDGFLTDAPEEVVAGLALGGFAPDVERSRHLLAGDTTIWEEKHACRTLVMLSTRTGFGVDRVDGRKLPAAGGAYKPDAPMIARFKALGRKAHEAQHGPTDAILDGGEAMDKEFVALGRAEALAELAMKRDGRIVVNLHALPSARDYVQRGADGVGSDVKREIRWEFDYKRRPLPETVHTAQLTLDGVTYEHVSYATKPWATFGDWLSGRGAMDLAREGSVKTEHDAQGVLARIGRALESTDRKTYIRGGAHRAAAIATLRGLRSRQLICDWLDGTEGPLVCGRIGQAFEVELTANDWKNAGRPSRSAIDFALLNHYGETLETLGVRRVSDSEPEAASAR